MMILQDAHETLQDQPRRPIHTKLTKKRRWGLDAPPLVEGRLRCLRVEPPWYQRGSRSAVAPNGPPADPGDIP